MKTSDQPLRVTDTNTAVDFSGSFCGIALPLIRFVIVALVGGFLGFLVLQSLVEISTRSALLIAFTPALVCAVVLVVFFQGKPPSYASDLFDSLLTHGHATPLFTRK